MKFKIKPKIKPTVKTSTSAMKLYDYVGKKYNDLDVTQLSVRKQIIDKFKEKNPTANVNPVLVKDPGVPTNMDSVTKGYVFGPIKQDSRAAAMTKVMKRRIDSSTNPSKTAKYVGKPNIHETIDNSVKSNLLLYIPADEASARAGGFHIIKNGIGTPYVSALNYMHSPLGYRFTGLHEGISHPTDFLLEDIIRKRDVLTKQHSSVLSDYEKMAYPDDIFNKGILNKVLGDSSKKGVEARALHWEVLLKIYEDLAEKNKVTVLEIVDLPDAGSSLVELFIDTHFKNPEQLANYIELFPSKYAKDYAKLLKSQDSEAANAYKNRINNILKYAPVATAITTVTSLIPDLN